MRTLTRILPLVFLALVVGCDTGGGALNLTGDETSSVAGKKADLGYTPVYFEATGNYYAAFASEEVYWAEALDETAKLGKYQSCYPHLATLTSPEENEFVVANFPDAVIGSYFLGGYQPEGNAYGDPAAGWTWVTGEAFDWTNWAEGEPNDSGRGEAEPPDPSVDTETVLNFLGHYGDDETGLWNDIGADPMYSLQEGYVVEWTCGRRMSSATGSGSIGSRRFSFTAEALVGGTAGGKWQIMIDGRKHQGEVECLTVSGIEAWFAGVTTRSSDEDQVGIVRGFRVVDNGEGTAWIDQLSLGHDVTDVYLAEGDPIDLHSAAGWCAFRPAVELHSIEGGNVQVH